MKRREFIKKVGIGSAALASVPTLAHALLGASQDGEKERTASGFRFVCVSQANRVGQVQPRNFMNGCGTFHGSDAQGGGSYDIFDQLSPIPRTLISAGKWQARRVLSLDVIGTYGVLAAGIIEMEVRLKQEIPSREVIHATLRVACSIGAAGLDSGEPEGFTLTIPGGRYGPFRPFEVAPGVTQGITVFTTSNEE
jgi:hypothetical protein